MKGPIWFETDPLGIVWQVYQNYEAPRYKRCNDDRSLFFQHSPSGGVTILIVYVDDIIITGSDTI